MPTAVDKSTPAAAHGSDPYEAASAWCTPTDPAHTKEPQFRAADYGVILKPRVMSLVVFTALVGLVLAPGSVGWGTALAAVLCIAVGAGASGAINMWYDADIDRLMTRTRLRPTANGRMRPRRALGFGIVLAIGSVACMALTVNGTAAALLAVTILYYVLIYTIWLKRRTPQNIVIGGAAGALPPMIGWAAVTGEIGAGAVALFAIIFLWTPPHTWALALFRRGDYSRAGIPMLPVVAGERETKRQMVVYTGLLVPATLVPLAVAGAGWLYGITAILLGMELARRVWTLWKEPHTESARPLFFFTIFYLFGIFAGLLVDRGVQGLF